MGFIKEYNNSNESNNSNKSDFKMISTKHTSNNGKKLRKKKNIAA